MQPRIDPAIAMPEVMQAMGGVEAYIRRCGLEPSLIGLVMMRASQINGCAFCIYMHTRDAPAHAKPRSACTCWMPGRRHRCTAIANASPWPGPRR